MMVALSPEYAKYAENKDLAFSLTLYTCLSATGDENSIPIAQGISLAHPNATVVGFDGFVGYGVGRNGIPSILEVNSSTRGHDKKGKPIHDRKGFIVTYKGGVEIHRQLYSEYIKK